MIKDKLAILTAKSASFLARRFNLGSGTNLPGRLALKISPYILAHLVPQTKKEILAITGTNGKTTTCGFIASILENAERKIAHNKKGANMLPGVTTAVIEAASSNAKFDIDNCLFESDEAYLHKFADFFSADYLLVTNLFRDQLDRYGELDTTAKKIDLAIDKFTKTKELTVILNADDPSVAKLGKNASKIYYGFSSVEFCNVDDTIKTAPEVAECECGKKFRYSKNFYGHVGHYYCDCGNKRPVNHISARAKIHSNFFEINITYPEKDINFSTKVNMPGLYNAYNALAAIALALEMGISVDNIKKGLENYLTIFGRAEKLRLKGKDVLIQLIKNPAGATEVLRTVKDDPNSRLLIIINDNYADGRDVSWLWDANFELLGNFNNQQNKKILTSGIRASDMALRLKYADLSSENIEIEENISKAIEKSLINTQEDEKLYILPTYTALLEMQKILKKFK